MAPKVSTTFHAYVPPSHFRSKSRDTVEDEQPNGAFTPSRTNTTQEVHTRLTFIDLSSPEAVRDRNKVRSARSHAVTVALAKKRMKARQEGNNFRVTTLPTSEPSNAIVRTTPPTPINPSSIDPFETLTVNATRLTVLLHLKSSLHAGEPVFGVNDAIHYQSLWTSFESGLTDGALAAAVSLTLSFAASGWRMNRECTESSLLAMRQMRHKLANPITALSSATIGKILLLLGVAVNANYSTCPSISHLCGVETLIGVAKQRDVDIPLSLKRAIFWQDLFCSVFLGTDRIVGYAGFFPGHEVSIELLDSSMTIPLGFFRSAHLLGSVFLDIVKDVASLYANREQWFMPRGPGGLVDPLPGLDNIQARLEDSLHTLRQNTTEHVALSCIIATYLCVYGFWDSVWNSPLSLENCHSNYSNTCLAVGVMISKMEICSSGWYTSVRLSRLTKEFDLALMNC